MIEYLTPAVGARFWTHKGKSYLCVRVVETTGNLRAIPFPVNAGDRVEVVLVEDVAQVQGEQGGTA